MKRSQEWAEEAVEKARELSGPYRARADVPDGEKTVKLVDLFDLGFMFQNGAFLIECHQSDHAHLWKLLQGADREYIERGQLVQLKNEDLERVGRLWLKERAQRKKLELVLQGRTTEKVDEFTHEPGKLDTVPEEGPVRFTPKSS